MDKNIARLRRAKTTRSHTRKLGVARLSVLRSGQHIYAQLFTSDGSKVLASAIANAENSHNLDVDSLVVAEASVGKALTMKRFHARARGKSTRILKPFSRLRIVVREQEEEA